MGLSGLVTMPVLGNIASRSILNPLCWDFPGNSNHLQENYITILFTYELKNVASLTTDQYSKL